MNKSQQVVKAYSTDNTVEAKLTEGINQANKLTLSVPLKDRLDSNIFYALIPTDDSTNYLMFKLNDESIENDRITYTGIDAAYDELRGYAYIKEIRPVNRTAKEILQLILEDTRWEVGYIDSSTPTNTFFYYQSVLECIQQVVQLFNVELTFTYSFNTKTQEITARNVNIYKQQGRRTGKRFEYGSNLLTVTREEDSQDIVTALVGRGKGEEKLDDDTGEATGGYGRRINFKDVVWSKANGDPTDKPAGQEYVENKEATKIFGYDDGTPRTGIAVFEDIEDPAELLKATWASLLSSCRPKVCFKASVTDVGDLRLGDTIAIIRHDLGIEYFTRVFKVVRDLKNEQNNTVEMGDDLSQNTLTSYVTDISNTANQAVQQANNAVVSAGSKNKNYYSTTKPKNASEGDNLFLNLGNGEFEYWVWHNNQWEFIQSTQDLDVVKQNVKQAQDDIKKTNEDLEKSKEDFNKSFVDLGKSVVDFKGSLNDLDKDLEGAKGSIADLDKSVGDFKGSMAELDKQVKDNQKINSDNYTVVVGKIKDLSDNSVDKNSFSELSQTVTGINTQVNSNNEEISSLTQTVKGINTEVSNNKGEISDLTQTVKGISTNVSNNQGEISELKQSVKGISTSVSNNSGYISTIKQTIKGINSSVSDNQSNISSLTQTVKGISTSVENNSSDISTLKQTAEGLQTQVSDNSGKLITINQTVEGVKVTAEDGIKKYTELSQTVDGLRSKVDQGVNHSEIQQLKDQIDLKVSKGDVVSELNLEAGRALISSNKIVLDADSVIFNGKAFIPDAAITNISADKITAGTLDAGKINVININADNIVAGTISGKNVNMNLTTGDIRFTAGRFHNSDDTFDINIDENYFYSENTISTGPWTTSKSSLLIKDGQLQLTQGTRLDQINNPYLKIFRSEGLAFGIVGNALARASVIAGNESIALVQDKFDSNGNEQFLGPFFEQQDEKDNWVQSYLNSDFVGVGVSRPYGTGMFLKKVPFAIYISSGEQQAKIRGKKIIIENNPNNGESYIPRIIVGQEDVPFDLNDSMGKTIHIGAESIYLQEDQSKNSTGFGANVYLDAFGKMYVTTSASRFKQNIKRNYDTTYGNKLLNLPTATWKDKSEVKKYEAGEIDHKPRSYYGMIAEDLDKAGLDMLVTKENGKITGIQYDRIGVALIPVIKELKEKIKRLESKINEQSKCRCK